MDGMKQKHHHLRWQFLSYYRTNILTKFHTNNNPIAHFQQSYFRNINTILPQTLMQIQIQSDNNNYTFASEALLRTYAVNLKLANALHALKCLHTEEWKRGLNTFSRQGQTLSKFCSEEQRESKREIKDCRSLVKLATSQDAYNHHYANPSSPSSPRMFSPLWVTGKKRHKETEWGNGWLKMSVCVWFHQSMSILQQRALW